MKTQVSLYDEIGQFTAIPNWAIEMGSEIGTDGLVLMMALRYHSGNNGLIFPAYDTLKKHTGLSYRKIAAAIRKLEDLTIVERQKRFGKSTIYRLKNRYTPTSPATCAGLGEVTVLPQIDSSPATGVGSVLPQVQTNKTPVTRLIEQDSLENDSENLIIYPVQPERIISTWDLRKNEKVKNPSAKKALDQGLSKPEVEKTKFWWLSEYSRPLMDAFVVASGVEPIKGDYKMWAKEAENWYLHHLTVSDIVQAIKQLRAKNYTVGQPKAVTVTAIAIHCNPTGEQQGTLDSLERAGFTYGGS